MKTRTSFFIALLLLTCSIAISKEVVTGNTPAPQGSINVFSSPDLFNLTMKWATEYNRLNPAPHINVIKSADNSIPGILKTYAGIGFISSETYTVLDHQSTWSMVVGRDVIVPVMNAKNPLLEEINRKGITAEGISRLFSNPGKQNWGMLLGTGQNTPVHCYIMNDASVKPLVAKFLNNDQVAIDGINLATGPDMIAAIQNDPDALGFCRLIDVMDPGIQNLAGNLKLVPIDKNGNGKIDFMENIYDNLQSFTRGVWIGKYPKALSGNIYSVAPGKPNNDAEVAFLRWVLSDGQQYLSTNGYSDLVNSERQTQADKLNTPAIYVATSENDSYATIRIIVMIAIVMILVSFMVSIIVSRFRGKKVTESDAHSETPAVFSENSVNIPKGLYFDKTHTWAFMEKDGSVKIGIDDFLQHITGPLSGIGMKPAGVKIKKGDPLLTIIQKGKHLIIYSPVSGTITAGNQGLITDSSALNAAPYTDGWVYMIEPTNWPLEIQFLSMADKYKTWLKGEFSRLKDFITAAVNPGTPGYAFIPMQDGGEITDNILADLGPEVWEDFQTKFIDNVK